MAGLAATAATISVAKIVATKPPPDISAGDVGGGSFTMPALPTAGSAGSSGAGPGVSAAPKAQTMFKLGQGGPGGGVSNLPAQKVYVVESDITSTQNRVAVIQSRASVS
jgi:hypothetical protein